MRSVMLDAIAGQGGNPLRVLLRLRPWLIALALVYALYLLAGNVFLNTRLGWNAVNHEPERFHSYRRDGVDSGRMLAAIAARR